MKKILSVILVFLMLCPMFSAASFAAEPQFEYNAFLTSDGKEVAKINSLAENSLLDLEIDLRRTDVSDSHDIWGVQFSVIVDGMEPIPGTYESNFADITHTCIKSQLDTSYVDNYVWMDLGQVCRTVENPLTVRNSFKVTDPAKVSARVTYVYVLPKDGNGVGLTPTDLTVPADRVTLKYDSNGGTVYAAESYTGGMVVDLNKKPSRGGYTFTGWYADPDCAELITRVVMDCSKTVYAGWRPAAVSSYFKGRHHAYITGYPDGTVRPEANITRAEAATIIYNLLSDDIRSTYTTGQNTFPDVNEGAWYNIPVSTLAAMDIVNGYTDGKFYGEDDITRAEFVAIIAKFAEDSDASDVYYNDVYGHWAQQAIAIAANNGWVHGYNDGSFKPEKAITRAEVISIVNEMLHRNPQTRRDLLNDMVTWPDNMDTTKWYYMAVQEATNSHSYRRKANGYESWTAIIKSEN